MVSVGYFGMDFQTSPADLAEPPLGAAPESREASEADHIAVAGRAGTQFGLQANLPDAKPQELVVGVPTRGGACVYKLGKMLLQDGDGFIQGLGGWTPLIVGVVVALFLDL